MPAIHALESAPIRGIAVDQSARWLREGWADFMRRPLVSLSSGLVFAAAGYLLVVVFAEEGLTALILPAAGGFILVGPFAALILYEVSRRDHSGLPVTASAVVGTLAERLPAIANLGLVFLMLFLLWMVTAMGLFALFFATGTLPPLDEMAVYALLAPENIAFLATGTAVGAVFAAVAFAIGVVSVPAVLDRGIGAAEAVALSLRTVRANWRGMIGWAATIAVVVAAGLALAFAGLAVALPVTAFASWHAYRDLIGQKAETSGGTAA